jgi:hypothetical protein
MSQREISGLVADGSVADGSVADELVADEMDQLKVDAMDPVEVDKILQLVEKNRDGPLHYVMFHLVEDNRHNSLKLDVMYQTFFLHSRDPAKSARALEVLQSSKFAFAEAHLGSYLCYTGNQALGIPLLESAASCGHKGAQHDLAVYKYKSGDPVMKECAIVQLKELDAQGCISATFSLGKILYQDPVLQLKDSTGNILPYDATGYNLIRKAAAAGYPTAFEYLNFLDRSTR